jgi:hypothetical protein
LAEAATSTNEEEKVNHKILKKVKETARQHSYKKPAEIKRNPA